MIGRIVAGVIGGFIVAFLTSNITTLITTSKSTASLMFLFAWGLSIFFALKSQRAARAWRWLLVSSASLSFFVPLATLIWTAKAKDGAEVIGGLVATGFLGVVFFLVGLAFLVIGLLIGRDKHIVVIENKD